MPSHITTGSFSRIQVFETCPYRAKLAYVDKLKEPVRPPLPNGKEYPNDRGTRVHDYAENYVRGLPGHEDLIPELFNFTEELQHLRAIHAQDPSRVIMEDMWLFDDSWTPLPQGIEPWDKRIWLRIKLDVCFFMQDMTHVVVIDHKTGKRYGNEIKHAEQTQLYALATCLRYPEVEKITTELWYLDQDEIASMTFKRSQAERFLKNWNNKMLALTDENAQYIPRPSVYSCRYCPFKTGLIGKLGPEGTGDCDRNPI